MITVKRYANRKLYNTETKQYITLEGIAALIQAGEELQVIDHASKEDLTAMTLAQIIFEQEKKGEGRLSQGVLTRLVKMGGSTVESFRRSLTHPFDLARQFNQELERRIQLLINQKDLSGEEGHRLLAKLTSFKPAEQSAQDSPQEELPTRKDIQNLSQQIDVLATVLDNLQDEKTVASDE